MTNRCHCKVANESHQRSMLVLARQLGMVGVCVDTANRGWRPQTVVDSQMRGVDDKPVVLKDWTAIWLAELAKKSADGPEGEVWVHNPLPDKPPPVGTTPGAVPVVPGAWDFEASPYAKYTLQPGDTFVGLATTYLGNGGRWKEIWQLNPQVSNPDKIIAGNVINMPAEAAAAAQKWIHKNTTDGDKKSGPGLLAWILGGAAVAIAGTGLAMGAAHLAKKRRRSSAARAA